MNLASFVIYPLSGFCNLDTSCSYREAVVSCHGLDEPLMWRNAADGGEEWRICRSQLYLYQLPSKSVEACLQTACNALKFHACQVERAQIGGARGRLQGEATAAAAMVVGCALLLGSERERGKMLPRRKRSAPHTTFKRTSDVSASIIKAFYS